MWGLEAPPLEVSGLINSEIVDFLWEAYRNGWTAEEARQEDAKRQKRLKMGLRGKTVR